MRDELTDLARELVSIDSVNPDLVPGGAGEDEVSRFVAAWLERHGLEVERNRDRARALERGRRRAGLRRRAARSS